MSLAIMLLLCLTTQAQITPADIPATTSSTGNAPTGTEVPNAKRIRRHISLIIGVEHDEEFLIPDKEIAIGGRTDFFDIKRIKDTDFFRIFPRKAGSGITTLKDRATGQILVEIRFTIRDDANERILREVQALLGDVEGIEFKIINDVIYIDGYVLIPKDLVRIGQITGIYEGRVRSLATLSPLSWKKIADFITTEVNNPEVRISAVGGFLKLEGQVNSDSEKKRIFEIVKLYIPDLVVEKTPSDFSIVTINGRKNPTVESFIIDLITVRKDDEKVEPPPKMIQIVAHFVKFGDNYSKGFRFTFSPAFSALSSSGQPANSTIDSTINLLNNLLPKLNWSKKHGYAKVLDTASILIQDKIQGSITRNVITAGPTLPPTVAGGLPTATTINATVSLRVTPTIKSERSGLVELKGLSVSVSNAGGEVEKQTTTTVDTTISVRDRQSAAFGGVIKKGTETSFGSPVTPNNQFIITLDASKSFNRDNSQFVVFVTPIIKSSASSGVEQVKKKFRLRD